MKFIVLALTISVAFCGAGAGIVGTASLGNATWTNGTTVAASICNSPASIVFSTVPDTANDVFILEFLFTANPNAVVAKDNGFGCKATVGASAAFPANSVVCDTVIYANSTSRVTTNFLTVS